MRRQAAGKKASTRPVRTPPSAPESAYCACSERLAQEPPAKTPSPDIAGTFPQRKPRGGSPLDLGHTPPLPPRRLALAAHQVSRISPRNNVGDNDAMLDMPRDEFEGLVSEALDLIPPELTALMRNVVVLVEDDRPDPDLAAITGC